MTLLAPIDTGPLVAELARRRDSLVAGLDGSVLVLSGPPAVLPPAGSGSVTSGSAAPGTVGHIVTAGWLAAAADLDAAVAALVARLAPGGRLHVVEPTRSPARATPAHHQGWFLDRDLPAALRRHALVLTDLERFSMPVSPSFLRPWVQGRARLRAEAVAS